MEVETDDYYCYPDDFPRSCVCNCFTPRFGQRGKNAYFAIGHILDQEFS
jgi:hypothetical protein